MRSGAPCAARTPSSTYLRAGRCRGGSILSGLGDNVFLVWEDGYFLRYGIRDLDDVVKVEARDLVPEEGGSISALIPLIGKASLIVADNQSRLRSWFLATSDTPETDDGMIFMLGRDLDLGGAQVTALANSRRNRTIAVGTSTGRVLLYFMPSEKLLCDVRAAQQTPVRSLVIAPRNDTFMALAGDWIQWRLDMGHPEATVKSLFGRVLYEGRDDAEFVWQTSGATDEAESKQSLVPLVFGTLKATVYSMLFAVPLALLAAIYTSEFLHPGSARGSSPSWRSWPACPAWCWASWRRS